MHYPVMTERQVAAPWKINLKTMWRWRLAGEGPVWHKLFHHVRDHEAHILEFERQGAQHWQAILGERELVGRAVTHHDLPMNLPAYASSTISRRVRRRPTPRSSASAKT